MVRARLFASAVGNALLIVGPIVLYGRLVVDPARRELLALDLVHSYLPAARAVLDGLSPYPPLGDASIASGTAYVYPPLVALVVIPLLALPLLAVQCGALLVGLLSVAATLWLLGVRDVRCYSVALLWAPVLAAVQVANVSLLFALGTALAWRWRERELRCGAVAGVLLAVKLFTWPLVIWLALTRRIRGAALAICVAAVTVVSSWAAIGFAGLTGYRATLEELEDHFAPTSYSVLAVALDAGLDETAARAVWLGCAIVAVLTVTWFAARADERRAFTVAVAATLVCTPVIWLHYFALLLIPVALASPGFSWLWLTPMLLWVGSGTGNGDAWETVWVMTGALLTVALCLRPDARTSSSPSPVARMT